MNKTQYLKLRDGSTSKTFVITNRAELHKQVRAFLAFAVKHYASKDGSHKLDGNVALRVAYDFGKGYAAHVRSALSKVKGDVVWSIDKSGVPSYSKPDIERKPVPVDEVLATMNESLDKIDADTAPTERTAEQKLASKAKAFTTGLINADTEKLNAAMAGFEDLESDELRNLYENLTTMASKIEAMLTLNVASN